MKYLNHKAIAIAIISATLVQAAAPAFAQEKPIAPLGTGGDIFDQNPQLGAYMGISTVIDVAVGIGSFAAGYQMNKAYQSQVQALSAAQTKVLKAKEVLDKTKTLPLHEERLAALKGLREEIRAVKDMKLGKTPAIHIHSETTLSESEQYLLLSNESKTIVTATNERIKTAQASLVRTNDATARAALESDIAYYQQTIETVKKSDAVYESWQTYSKSVYNYDQAAQRIDQGVLNAIEQHVQKMEGEAAYTQSEKQGLVASAKAVEEEATTEFNALAESVGSTWGFGTFRYVAWGGSLLMTYSIGSRCYQVLILQEKPSFVPLIGIPVQEVRQAFSR